MEEKFCKFCGEKIPMDAVICTHCGRQVEELKSSKPDNIVINNSASAAASASNINKGPIKRKHSILFNLFMIVITGGLWIIWMIIRPKYY
ncbi:MAG: zinc-ribbon domain-containing protein [Clostridium sp.]